MGRPKTGLKSGIDGVKASVMVPLELNKQIESLLATPDGSPGPTRNDFFLKAARDLINRATIVKVGERISSTKPLLNAQLFSKDEQRWVDALIEILRSGNQNAKTAVSENLKVFQDYVRLVSSKE